MKNGIINMLLPRNLVCTLGVLLLLGNLNAVEVADWEVTLSVNNGSWYITGVYDAARSPDTSTSGYVKIYWPSGAQARNIFVSQTFSKSESWANPSLEGNWPCYFLPNGGSATAIGTIIVDAQGNVTADVPNQASYYSYSETIINNTDEAQPYSVEILNEQGKVIGLRQYWLQPGQMVPIDLESDNPFSVRIKTAGYDSQGYYVSSEIIEEASSTAGDKTGSLALSVAETALIYGDGVTNPDLPYSSELNMDGQQIIDALEIAMGSQQEQVQSLQNFMSYLHGQNMTVVENVFQQVTDKSAQILANLATLEVDINSTESSVLDAISLLNTAANDRDTALREYIYTRTTELDGLSSTVANILTTAQSVKTDTTIASNYLSDIQSKVEQINSLSDPVAKASKIAEIKQLLENYIAANPDTLEQSDLDSLEANITGLYAQIPLLITDEIQGTETLILSDISILQGKIDSILADTGALVPEISQVQLKLDQLAVTIADGNFSPADLTEILSSLTGVTQAMLDTNAKPEIADLASGVVQLATGISNMNFTGDYDTALLNAQNDTTGKLDALNTLTAGQTNLITETLQTQTSDLKQALIALGYEIPEPPDYTAKFDELKLAIETRPVPIDYTPILEHIRDRPDPELPAPIDNTTVLAEIRDNTGNTTTELEELNTALNPEQIEIDIKTSNWSTQAQSIAHGAKNSVESAVSAELTGLSINPSYSSSAGSWPSFTIPVVGTIDMNPWEAMPWLTTLGSWSLNILRWVSSAAFLIWFFRQLDSAMRSIGTTPVQGTSGGGATGGIAAGKQLIISAAFVAAFVVAIVAFITVMKAPIIDVVSIATSATNMSTGAPSMAAFGLSEIAKLVPVSHLLSLFALTLLIKQIQIPAVMGMQILVRVFTI